jgi:glyoxylase-like metal-dependent hydrolase (beta-lactamase superfamily II)
MKRWIVAMGVLAGVGASPMAAAQFGSTPAEVELIEVSDEIYVIHNAYVPGNVTALVTDEGVLLIDTKYAIDYDNIAMLLATVTDQPIRYVINTHYHDDHSGGNRIFQGDGATVVASANARLKMVGNGRAEGLPNITIEDTGSIHIGGTLVDLYYFGRAHTDGDIVAHLPEHGLLVTGDVYANDPGTPEYIDYGGGGSAREWPQTLNRVLDLDFETVIPGHGTVVPRSGLEDFRDDTARLAEMVQSMNRQGRSRDEIEAMLRSEFNFADFHVQGSLDGLLVELQ